MVAARGERLELAPLSIVLAIVFVACSRDSDAGKIEPLHESVASSHPSASASASAAADDLDATIDLAISMLEKESYRPFLERFIAPLDRKKLSKDGGIDAILPEFAKGKAQSLLEMLRSIRGTKPRVEGDEAVFETKDKDMRWVLDHGKWYIRN